MNKRFAALAATFALALAGCGNSTGAATPGTADVKVDDALVAKLPDAIKTSKVIKVGTNPTYAPIEGLQSDGKTVEGVDIDLFNAVMAKFGVKVDWQQGAFDGLIAGITAKKYDAGASAFTIRKDRLEVVNMVQYFSAGIRWAVAKGNPKGFDYKSICGRTVAVQTGTYEETDVLPALQKNCGGKKIDILPFAGQDEAAAAVVNGRAEAFVADSPVTDYGIKVSGDKLEAQGDMYEAAPYGFVFQKDQKDFADAVAVALKALKDDGTYGKILDKWGVGSGAVTEFTVNPSV